MPTRLSVARYDASSVQGEGAWVEVSSMTVADMREAQNIPASEDFEYTLELFKNRVRDWNWVDNDGEPMPSPSEDPDILDEITSAEFNFLVECIKGNEAKLKN